ncbi:MAG: threonine ammonia-lyase [Bacteroidales bacterium]
MAYYPRLEEIEGAYTKLHNIVEKSPLMHERGLSSTYGAEILFKREDLQITRSYKLRGAYNKISSLSKEEIKRGVVCASAGNHAQGVAYSCKALKIKGYIFMPETTPRQKLEQVKLFGGQYIETILAGDTFDAAFEEALFFSKKENRSFIHPFNDSKIIEGQATIGLEILESCKEPIDYLFLPIGGGGVASGVGSLFKMLSPSTKVIGVEPAGAASMKLSLERGEVTELPVIDRFVDGAAVKKVGELTFKICSRVLDETIAVPEGAVCSTILEMYNKNAIVLEPAGALTIAALELYAKQIKGKRVVALLSGGNNDIGRTEEIRERAQLYQGVKHYFIVRFPQRSGALLSFVRNVLGPNDDITHFSYSKKTNREKGPALIGVELSNPKDLEPLINRMINHNFIYQYINDQQDLFELLV